MTGWLVYVRESSRTEEVYAHIPVDSVAKNRLVWSHVALQAYSNPYISHLRSFIG